MPIPAANFAHASGRPSLFESWNDAVPACSTQGGGAPRSQCTERSLYWIPPSKLIPLVLVGQMWCPHQALWCWQAQRVPHGRESSTISKRPQPALSHELHASLLGKRKRTYPFACFRSSDTMAGW
jgi:hypothetical protein